MEDADIESSLNREKLPVAVYERNQSVLGIQDESGLNDKEEIGVRSGGSAAALAANCCTKPASVPQYSSQTTQWFDGVASSCIHERRHRLRQVAGGWGEDSQAGGLDERHQRQRRRVPAEVGGGNPHLLGDSLGASVHRARCDEKDKCHGRHGNCRCRPGDLSGQGRPQTESPAQRRDC